MTDTCRNGHRRTPENTYVTPGGRTECRTCRKERLRRFYAAHPGYSTERVRKYRSDPEKREKDRERSRRWKDANRERNRARDREYDRRRRAPVTSGGTGKTPGNQIGPATGATVRDRGNQEGTS